MVQILNGNIIREDITRHARGGTELIAESMVKYIDHELLKNFQIVHSRVRDLDSSKKKIFVAHDLPGDPESEFLKSGGYNKFDSLVFVSNWQMQRYIEYYGIPWHKCVVMKNAIEPLQKREPYKDGKKVKLVYHTTPHRGLTILTDAVQHLREHREDFTLDVFSSFSLYGWEERDEQYRPLFDFLESTPWITYHGAINHEELMEKLPSYDIFAYPSIWPETSCISLMEAMSAGLLCLHSNYAALPETAGDFTMMYQYKEDPRDHLKTFTNNLNLAIDIIQSRTAEPRFIIQSSITDLHHSWNVRGLEWSKYLERLL